MLDRLKTFPAGAIVSYLRWYLPRSLDSLIDRRLPGFFAYEYGIQFVVLVSIPPWKYQRFLKTLSPRPRDRARKAPGCPRRSHQPHRRRHAPRRPRVLRALRLRALAHPGG
jgi:hypothetical protein